MAFIIVPLYCLTVTILLVVIFFASVPKEVISSIEFFIRQRHGILLSLGTLFLVSAIGYVTTVVAGLLAERREKASHRVQSELKIADFRQRWINEMRDDLSRYIVLLGIHGAKKDAQDSTMTEEQAIDFNQVQSRILLRLNQTEPLGKKVYDGMRNLQTSKKEDRRDAIFALTDISNEFLRNEWKRLKTDLKHARLLEDET